MWDLEVVTTVQWGKQGTDGFTIKTVSLWEPFVYAVILTEPSRLDSRKSVPQPGQADALSLIPSDLSNDSKGAVER